MSETETRPYSGPTYTGGYRRNYRVNGTTITESSWINKDSVRSETVTKGESPWNWKQLIALGEYAGSELSGTRYRIVSQRNTITDAQYSPAPTNPTSQLGTYSVYPIAYSSDYTYPSPSHAGLAPYQEALEGAKADFLKRLIAYQRSVSGGVALGEIRETLRMIRNPARALSRRAQSWHREAMKRRAQRARRNSRRPRAYRIRDIERDLGDSWLEQSFGWQPLLNDIDDGAKALARINTETFGQKAIGADASRSGPFAATIEGYLSGNLCRIRREVRKNAYADVRLHGKVKADVGNPTLMKARLLGFSAQDFVPTLWELTPWSFLIDYFVNIGEVLEGWSWGTTGLKWCELNSRKSARYEISYRPYNYASNTRLIYSQNGEFVTETTVVSRSRYLGGFTPSVRWEVPGFKSLKWLNVAALARLRVRERQFRL